MPDFTDCERIPRRVYGGANGSKLAIRYQGEIYMLKFPTNSRGNKQTDLSYTNSCISEYLASHIFNMVGINSHETILGTYQKDGAEKVVCACKDFTADGKTLYDFTSIKNVVVDSAHHGSGTELASILEAIDEQDFLDPEYLKGFFWDMFVMDAFLGNFDRHNGNWGVLYDAVNDKAEIAPVFDCAGCFLPQADERTIKKVLSDENELNMRIYRFPTSAIKQGRNKINYYDFFISGEYTECDEALLRMAPRIDMEKIKGLIRDTPYINELQKDFYSLYIDARYEKIIVPAYELAVNREQERQEAWGKDVSPDCNEEWDDDDIEL